MTQLLGCFHLLEIFFSNRLFVLFSYFFKWLNNLLSAKPSIMTWFLIPRQLKVFRLAISSFEEFAAI